MAISFLESCGLPCTSGVGSPDARPRGAHRLVIATDDRGNQALRLVPEDRAKVLAIMPPCGAETDRRAIEDEFARIGDGLTALLARPGDGERHPG